MPIARAARGKIRECLKTHLKDLSEGCEAVVLKAVNVKACAADVCSGSKSMSAKCQKQTPFHARSITVTLWSRGELYFGGLRVGPKIATLSN
jgi:hypothetical protein